MKTSWRLRRPRPARRAMLRFIVGCALVAFWILVLRPVGIGGPAGYIIVAGHSMEPTYWTGDLVVTQVQRDYAVGDVIAFQVGEDTVIHRIIGGDATTGFKTKGDNNEGPDPWRPRADTITGRLWVALPKVGLGVQLLRQPSVLAALAAGIAFFVAFGGSSKPAKPVKVEGGADA